MTTDVEAAKNFYTEVIGWNTAEWEGGPTPYTMWQVGDDSIGGVMELPEEARKAGAPSHWLAYVAVPNVDETAALAVELGGTVYREPTDIPSVGRFTVLADPLGSPFAAFTPEGDMPLHEGKARHGDFSWNELNTTDYEKAFEFYSKLFDWKLTESTEMGPGFIYQMYQRQDAEGSCGGMCNSAKMQNFPAHWVYYITVDDLDKAVAKAQDGGANLVAGPMEVPGGSRIAIFKDPQDAEFALHKPPR
jgi:predicted enzyme related to lactoylglutathione lyase